MNDYRMNSIAPSESASEHASHIGAERFAGASLCERQVVHAALHQAARDYWARYDEMTPDERSGACAAFHKLAESARSDFGILLGDNYPQA